MLGSTERFRSFVFVLSSIREEFSTEQEQYNSFRAVLFLFCPSIRNGLRAMLTSSQTVHKNKRDCPICKNTPKTLLIRHNRKTNWPVPFVKPGSFVIFHKRARPVCK
jgi:hypothetical protein